MKTKIFIVIVINILVFIALLIWWQKGTFITTNTSLSSPSSPSPSSPSSSPPSSPSAPALPVTTLKESLSPKKSTVVYRPEFEYLRATYGPLNEEGKIGGNFKGQDVTNKIKMDKDGNILNPFVCCDALGDPSQGIPKILTIFYKRNGRRYKAILQEKTPIEGRLPP
jgi:cytoskeletal protein RodZ